jgi:transcriptional regulator with XRE-family HTH domain
MEENKKRIPNQLVLLRKQRNLSQRRVARIIGLRDATLLSRYESGQEAPPLKTAMKLAALYDVTLPEIFKELNTCARNQVFGLGTRGGDPAQQRGTSLGPQGRTE